MTEKRYLVAEPPAPEEIEVLRQGYAGKNAYFYAAAAIAVLVASGGRAVAAETALAFNYTYSNLSRQQRDQLWDQSVADWKEYAGTHADAQPKKECSTTISGGKSYTFCNMTAGYRKGWDSITLIYNSDAAPGVRLRCLNFVLPTAVRRRCLSIEDGIEFVQTWNNGEWR